MAAQDLCSLADVRAALEIPAADTSRDTLIQTLITQASEVIMGEVDREFAPATASALRTFRVDGFLLSLAPYDLRTVTLFRINQEGTSPQTLAATVDYQLLPIGAPSGTYTSVRFSAYLASLYGGPSLFSMGYALCEITGAWGFATVPPDVNRACVLTVASWLRRDVTALAIQAALNTDPALTPATVPSYALPYDAKQILGPYRRLRSMVTV